LIVVPGSLLAAPRHYLSRKNQLGRCAAETSNYYRLYLHNGKVALAAMYLRRVRVVGRSFVAALTHLSTVVTPLAPAAHNVGVGLWRPWGQT
jgi:hypothetical protein